MLDVGGRQRGVGVVRRRREAARQRQQVLALLVEHVLLLAIEILDARSGRRASSGLAGHPLLHRRQRNLRAAPGLNQALACAAFANRICTCWRLRVDLVVALILVVPERREVPHLVRRAGRSRRDSFSAASSRSAPCAERALQRGVRGNLGLELGVGALPLVPVGEDVRQVPFEAIGNTVAVAQLGCSRRRCRSGERIHQLMISGVLLAQCVFARACGTTHKEAFMDHPRPNLRYVDAKDLDDTATRLRGLRVDSIGNEQLGKLEGFIIDGNTGRPVSRRCRLRRLAEAQAFPVADRPRLALVRQRPAHR